MRSIQKRHRKLPLIAFILLLHLQNLQAQQVPALEPVNPAYKPIAVLSGAVSSNRQKLDTIRFPWAEYSKGALGNALWRTFYLLPADEASLASLVKVPANSSDQTSAELDYLLRLQNTRTEAEIKRAEYIANIGSWPNILNPTDPDYEANQQQLYYIPATATGQEYDYKRYPATTKLLLNCIQDIRVTEFRLKAIFKRPRPYHLDTTLKPLMRINSPAFPSGHSLWAYTEAYLWGALFPNSRPAFIQAAAEVRWSRELLGIHYPSDNEASRIIGWHLLKSWYKNPQFVEDLKKAKAEWNK